VKLVPVKFHMGRSLRQTEAVRPIVEPDGGR
jgi:hypothetical protein